MHLFATLPSPLIEKYKFNAVKFVINAYYQNVQEKGRHVNINYTYDALLMIIQVCLKFIFCIFHEAV